MSILGVVLLLTISVIPGLQYAYAANYNLEIVDNETTWNDSYANWWLKVYYENNPSEDLWNTSTNSAPWFNDKIYTVQLYQNAGCEGDDYTTKQYQAQWYSDNGVQKIIDVDDNSIEYYIPTFFNVPEESFELFCGASGGWVATPSDLVYPADKCIKVTSVSFWWANVTHSWQGAVNAPGAKYPWAVISTQDFRWIIAFTYDYEDPKTVYPWWEEIKSKNVWIASIPGEFEDNTFLIPENTGNANDSWLGTAGESSAFDSTKFNVTLIPALTVTFDNWETTTTGEVLSWKTITAPVEPTKEWYVFSWWYLGDELFDFNTPITDDTTLTAKWLVKKTSWSSWGGGGWSSVTNSNKDKTASSTDDSKSGENTQDNTQINENENWTNNDNTDSQNSWEDNYNEEFQNAYDFAFKNGITTMPSINEADMESPLNRIAMAKMLSQYAINILGKTPDTTKTISFPDVDEELDAQYNNWVTLAYQLGIMWIWIEEFRPFDNVTRAEFVTALSRLLFWITDGENLYYETHMQKLLEEKIITVADPDMQELRWYVMIMLMRSAE